MSGPRILTDYHHHALAESLIALFADRLGGTVTFPFGMEFFERWYWSFERAWHGDAVARQYLEGIWAGATFNDGGEAFRADPRYPGRTHRGVTLDRALAEKWDLVLCSLPANYDGFYRLAQETGARYGVQLGNDTQQVDPRADFALVSTTLPGFGPEYVGRRFEVGGVPAVMYHQEFSLDTFRPGPPSTKAIASFVNCFPEGPSYPDFLALARAHPEFDWRVYGAYGTGPDDEFKAGDIGPVEEVADAMRAARIAYHTKHWSDGYGHTIHNWGAIGRPMLGYQRYYADKLAAPLWIEGVTTWDVESRTHDEIAALVRRLVEDHDAYLTACAAMAARFREIVDFGDEADAIADMLGVGARVAA